MATFMFSGSAYALLLAAALWAACASADDVSSPLCQSIGRIREYPIDSDATWFWLHRCNLTNISPDNFAGLPNLKHIVLFHNSIENIHPATFHDLPELNSIFLYNNKLKFVTFDMFEKNKLTSLSLHNNEITSLPPNFASRLNRAGAKLNYFFFYDNPWHCTCLIETLADVKRAGVPNYKDGHYDGTIVECVFHGAEQCEFRHKMLAPPHWS